MIRVLVADDNAIIRSGLRNVLELSDDIVVVAEAATGEQALAAASAKPCDVVLLDVRMPVLDGLAVVAPLGERAQVLMLTYAEEPEIVTQAIRRGASGYLVHGRFSPDELAASVREVANGHSVIAPAVAPAVFTALRDGATTAGEQRTAYEDKQDRSQLTEREREVIELLARGLANRAIAAELYLSEKTVKNHINRAYAKLGVTSRTEAMAWWLGVR